MGDSPAFQFYVADYVMGTMMMDAAERGVYMDCLCHQWSAGGVPGDDLKALARVMRVSDREAKRLWAAVGQKFTRSADGLWRNARLEAEREKQAAFRAAASEAGKKSAAARRANDRSTTVEPTYQRNANQGVGGVVEISLERNGNSSSSSSSSVPPAKNAGGDARARAASAPALIRSPLEREKALRFNAFVGARLEVPHKLHADFARVLGGDDPDTALRAWYAEVDAELESTREAIVPDVWKWLEARFKPWATNRGQEALIAAWVQTGEVPRGA